MSEGPYCGNPINEEQIICLKCGRQLQPLKVENVKKKDENLHYTNCYINYCNASCHNSSHAICININITLKLALQIHLIFFILYQYHN